MRTLYACAQYHGTPLWREACILRARVMLYRAYVRTVGYALPLAALIYNSELYRKGTRLRILYTLPKYDCYIQHKKKSRSR